MMLLPLLGAMAAAAITFEGPPMEAEEIYATSEIIEYSPPLLMKTKLGQKCSGVEFTPKSSNSEPRPLSECLVNFPDYFWRNAAPNNATDLIFDVTPDGLPHNIRIVRTTDDCFNKAAARGVAAWRYPATESGLFDITTASTFHLAP